jgi:hypothetical protein
LNPNNQENPFDNVGLLHNEALDYVLSGFLQIPFGAKDRTAVPLAVINLLSEFLYHKSGNKDIAELEEIVNYAYIAMGRSLSKRDANTYISAKAGTALKEYYTQLKLVLPYTDINNVADKLTAIRDLEKGIDSSGMPEADRKVAYWASSVARFSLAYWISEFNSEKSLWVSTVVQMGGWRDQPVKMAAGPPAWVYSDIKGAVLAAFSTGNPFVALGWGAGTSALDALQDYGQTKGWW